jgi:hypothetical protein
VHSELFVVNDELGVAGTFDGLYRDPWTGRLILGDKKTAAIKRGPRGGLKGGLKNLACAAQLGCYIDGKFYDPATGMRWALPAHVDQDWVIALHIPKDDGRMVVGAFPANAARYYAQLAVQVGIARQDEKKLIQPW